MIFSEDMEISILHTDNIFEHEQIESNEFSIRIIGLFHPQKLNGFQSEMFMDYQETDKPIFNAWHIHFNLGFQASAF